MKATGRTDIDTVGQAEFLPVAAAVTVLGGVGRVDLREPPAGAFSLAGEGGEEPGPGRVRNALGETMVVDHAVDLQVLHADSPVAVDDLPGDLVNEIAAPVGDALMDPGDDLPAPGPLGSPLVGQAQFALSPG